MDPSGWRIPVLVSNFCHETVMVEPFSEIVMVAQVSAIQPVMDRPSRLSCDPLTLPDHLQGFRWLTEGAVGEYRYVSEGETPDPG